VRSRLDDYGQKVAFSLCLTNYALRHEDVGVVDV
jgi:hypothetical protein